MQSTDPLPTLARLLALLDSDESSPMHEREARDAAIGRELDPTLEATERVQLWLRRMSPTSEQGLEAPIAVAGTLSVLFGVLLGMISAAALFYYDGSARVNALAVLGVLVGAPMVLLTFSWLSCLSVTRARVWPLVGGLLSTVAHLSPGRLTGWLARRMSRQGVEHARLLALSTGADPAIGSVRMWFYARWSHLVGVGYFSGALLTMLALIVFSDLVFGWSTTLELEPLTLQHMTSVMALPWSWLWPAASPSLELVESSQYFRAASAISEVSALAALGRWWPFLLMSVLIYGWLPRAVSAWVCARALDRAAIRALTEQAASRGLLERLEPPMFVTIEPRSDAAAAHTSMALGASGNAPDAVVTSASSATFDLVINWANVRLDDAVMTQVFAANTVKHAGGTYSIDEDDAVVAATPSGATSVVVCKGWEPPLLELNDFVSDLHARTQARVTIVPVSVVAGRLGGLATRDREVWSRWLPGSGAELRLDAVASAENDAE